MSPPESQTAQHSQTDSSAKACASCGFTLNVGPEFSAEIFRCPRCWRPWTLEADKPDSAPEIPVFAAADEIVFAEAEPDGPAEVVFDDSADDVFDQIVEEFLDEDAEELIELDPDVEYELVVTEEVSPVPQPLRVAQVEDEPHTWQRKVKEWFAGYGVSLVFHFILLMLCTLFVIQTEYVRWGEAIELTLVERDGALGEAGGFAEIEAPNIQQRSEVTSDVASDIIFSTRTTGSGTTSGTSKGGGTGGVGFFGTSAKGKSFVFVVDCSGSMDGFFDMKQTGPEKNQLEARSRLRAAREELFAALDGMDEDQQFAVVYYDEQSYLQPGTDGLQRATATNIRAAKHWISDVRGGGGTDPRDALRQALAMKPQVLYLLTDGEIPPETRGEAMAANSNHTIIHTTCIGSRDNPLMQLIADDHRGVYRSVTSLTSDGHFGIAIVAVTYEHESTRLKFLKLNRIFENILEKEAAGKNKFREQGVPHVIFVHNAISSVPEFQLELQKLIRAINSGTITDYRKPIRSGLLGSNVSLSRENKDLDEQTIERQRNEEISIEQFLKRHLGEHHVGTTPLTIETVHLQGEEEPSLEIRNGLDIFNLYNESKVRVIEGNYTR